MNNPSVILRPPVGIIAGGGVMPFAVADSLLARRISPVLFALDGACDRAQATRFRHHWIGIGQLGHLFKTLRADNCRDIVFIGTLVRPSLSDIRLDWGGLKAMPELIAAFRGGDDHLLSHVGKLFEREGFRMLGIRDVAPDLLMPAGVLTRAMPDADAETDIARGRDVLRALGGFDIGQAVIVIDGHVIAVEDIEGTDGLLARVTRLRSEGRIRAKAGRGVLVKGPKSGQDLRFDLPATGARTVDGVAAAGLAGVAIAAGQAIVADPLEMIAAADKAGVFIVGLSA